MPSEIAVTSNHEPEKGLPPVAPPSGKFIAQLFLVPLLIVGVVVLLVSFFFWLMGDRSDPSKLLSQLDSPNVDVRWRAASEFAQKLKRDPDLASSPKVALQLCTLLRQALDQFGRVEKDAAAPADSKARQTFLEKRKDIQFLSPCLGNLIIPTGAPLLGEVALRTSDSDPKTAALLRRQAVWALANLGDNLKQFQKLSPEHMDQVKLELEQEAAAGPAEQAAWARQTLEYLNGDRRQIRAIPILAECARADDPVLRELAAYALTFWDGDAEDNALAEKTLLALSYDDGHGVRVEVGEND